jgi:outer membrane protein insertion porin family
LLTAIRKIAAVLILLHLTVSVASAAEQRLSAVAIKGNSRVETAAIMLAVSSKAGELLDSERVDADVKAIYKLGHFQDVKADTEQGASGVALTYTVQEKPIVREVKIEGNKELALDKVKEAIEIKANTEFSPKELAKSVKKVKKFYADEGFYLAEVEATTEKRSANEINALFKIKEGKKILIKEIRFEGNKAFSTGKLKGSGFRRIVGGGVTETKERWMFSWMTDAGKYKEEMLRNDVNLIADLYYNNGYVNIRVGEPQVQLLEDKSGLLVTIGITEGEQFRTGAIDFKGDLLETADFLGRQVKLKTDEVFSRALLRADVFTLTDLYADKGYAFANVTPLTKADPQKKTIDITFDMEKGEKVYIERINVSGNTKSRDKVVRRELRLMEGELYSATGLKKSKQNLNNLGFFEDVNLATAKGSADNKLNLNVEVKEKATGTFSIGAGYSSIDGLIGQGSIQQANFLGLGLKANASASIGGKSQTYNLGLTDPYFLDSKWTLGGDVYRAEREYIDFSRRVTGGDIKAGYPISDILSTFWLYKYEAKEIFNESLAYQAAAIKPEANSTTSAIFASITRNSTDYRLDPSSGMVNTVSTEYAGLGGTNRFLRFIGETSLYFPVKWSTVFSVRGTMGYVQEIGKPVPIDEKFYLGGISTLRGYSSRTVSPFVLVNVTTTTQNPNGTGGNSSTQLTRAYIGGDKEAFFNAEYTFPLLKDVGLKGVAFFDAGNAYDTNQKYFSTVKTSYGGGIRWFSPIGPLRLEYGIPLNPRDGIDSPGGKLEFSIGGFF